MRTVLLIVLLLAGTGPLAVANGLVRDAKSAYPASLVERPMTLPPLMFQPSVELNISSYMSGDPGLVLGAAVDVGITRRLQLGTLLGFRVHPRGGFGLFLADMQINVVPQGLNLRLDVGTERLASLIGEHDTFIFGLGLPWRIKLHRCFALTGGSTWARGFGSPLFLGGPGMSNNVLVVEAFSNGDQFGGWTVAGTVHIPVGILIQPHNIISLSVTSGYRFVFEHNESTRQPRIQGRVHTHFIPLRFELIFNIARVVDLGFTATLLGFITGKGEGTVGDERLGFGVTGEYAATQKYDLWFAARF